MTTYEKFTDHPAHESFERAFRGGVNGCRMTCECGVEYWDSYNRGYDWNEGEIDALIANPNARALDRAVGLVEFEGRRFVDGCTCWHPRALKVLMFVLSHDEAIAALLTIEKKRKTVEAELSPVVADV